MRNLVRWFVGATCVVVVLAGCTGDTDDDSTAPTTEAPEQEESTPTTVAEEATEEPAEPDDIVDDLPPAPDPDPTPLPVDDAIRTGVLDNGLTWYVRSNDSPGQAVALRLVVRAGARQEDPVGTGVAHFLEHMMFNGTEAFPGNELDAALRSIGAQIGPDFNAYTSDNETVYQLGVEDRGDNVDIAFDVLAEWAARATIDPTEVANEAPVIREEARLRDEGGDGIINKAFEQAYFLETPLEGVNVVGTEQTINTISAEVLRAYYDTWYRPDNMAVIAVGDRSLDDLEKMIVDRFSDLEARGTSPDPGDVDFDLRVDPLVDVVIEPTFGDSFVSVDYPFQNWDLGTRDGTRLLFMEFALGQMMSQRLNDGISAGRVDLRTASAGRFWQTRHLQYMGFNVDAVDLVAGTEALMTEIEGTIRNGFTQDEMDRVLEGFRAGLEQQRATQDTTQDAAFADAMVEHFLEGTDLQSIDDSVDMGLEILDELTLQEMNDHWTWAMRSTAPIVLVVGPDAERVGEASDHLAAVERASQAEIGSVDDDLEAVDVLFPTPEPVEEERRSDLELNDGIRLEFANGMQVLFRESDISAGEVSVVSESPGGRSALSADDGAVITTAVAAAAESGIGEWNAVQVRRHLSDLNVFVSPYVSDVGEGFSGSASPDDLEALFQLIHGWVMAPMVEEVPLEQQIQWVRDDLAFAELDAAFAADIAVADTRTGGGGFAFLPTDAQLEALDPSTALELFESRFTSLDDHTIVIVGDVDEDRIIELSRTWIGSLPGAPAETATVPEPPGRTELDLSVGAGAQSGAYRYLSTGTADETIRNRVLAELANSLLNDRLFTVIRERLGATYGGSAFVSFEEPGDGAELYVSVDGDPTRIVEIDDAIEAELAAIVGGAIDPVDFAEARAVLESRYNFINNGFYIESLFDEAADDPARIVDRRRQVDVLQTLEPADLQQFMAAIVTDDVIEVRNGR